MGQELKAALLEAERGAAVERRRDEAWVRQRIHLDWTGWQAEEPVPHLDDPAGGVGRPPAVAGLPAAGRTGPVRQFERLVDPYGLVAKAGVWHLACVASGRLRVYRVADLLDVRLTDERFQRTDFDLAAFWGKVVRRNRDPALAVRGYGPRVAGAGRRAAEALWRLDSATRPPRSVPDAEGWLTVTLPFDTFESARGVATGGWPGGGGGGASGTTTERGRPRGAGRGAVREVKPITC